MKTKFLHYIAFCLGLIILLGSCKKEQNQVTTNGGIPGKVTASSTNIVLNKSKTTGKDTSVLFTFTKADFGFNAAVNYQLQIDSLGDNWKKPQTVTVSTGIFNQAVSTLDFNSLLLKLNLKPANAAQIQVRLASSATANLSTVYSEPITLTVTPFSIASSVYVPGAYQGWAPDAADSLTSPTSNGIYTGIINFTGTDPNFKITTARNWSTTTYGVGATTGTVSTTGDNLKATASGALELTLNTNNQTLVITPQWSIIGDASPGGWSNDTNLFLDKKKNIWYITVKLKSDGSQAIKFRFKNDWTVNLGGSGGTLQQGGDNIIIPKTAANGDNYAITLSTTSNTYTLIKQ